MSLLNPKNWLPFVREFRFASPGYLLLLLLLPMLMALIFRYRRRHAAAIRYSDIHNMKKISQPLRIILRAVLHILRLAVLAFLIIAMARPQMSRTGWRRLRGWSANLWTGAPPTASAVSSLPQLPSPSARSHWITG
ncbi:MAG: BatA domain-containing protein [Candidatus Sumerlaeota bacterium]|nr:BatA domain-containing protein [Candidatus Sumerlaeota bacterium]